MNKLSYQCGTSRTKNNRNCIVDCSRSGEQNRLLPSFKVKKKKEKDSRSSPPQSTEAAQLNEVGPKAYIGAPAYMTSGTASRRE